MKYKVKRMTKGNSVRFFALMTLCFIYPARAEVLDRIVAVVDAHIITLSDLRQEREIRMELGEKALDNNTAMVRELIDNHLIEQQISDYPNTDVTDAEVQTDLEKLNPRPAPSDRLRDAIRRRIRMQKFFDLKFRQFIRPTNIEIRRYYEQVFLPAAKSKGMQPIPPLTDPDMANGILENVTQETLDHEVDVWLEAIRRKSNVQIFD